VDSGFVEGDEVTVHYDPLIAKLITSGETREAARQRAVAAIRIFPILGIRTNTGLLLELLNHPRFIAGAIDTAFLDAEADSLRGRLLAEPPPEALAVAAVVGNAARPGRPAAGNDPWLSLRDVRL
jgi:acetyl/propionyl-CoA carboxylase alpha subunit